MKVGSFSPKVTQNLSSFESKASVTPQAQVRAEPRLSLPRDGFDVGGATRPRLRHPGDGFEASRPIGLQQLSGKTSISQLTELFKSGQLKAPTPTQGLEPLQGALDGIVQKAVDDTSLDNLGKIRKDISSALKELGLKGRQFSKVARELAYAVIGGKAGGIGAQWVPGD